MAPEPLHCAFMGCLTPHLDLQETTIGVVGREPSLVLLCRSHREMIRGGDLDRLEGVGVIGGMSFHHERDPWVERELAHALTCQIQSLDEVILSGIQARRELLRVLELSDLSDGPFRTQDGQVFVHSGGYAVGGDGRLHKEVDGRWWPQSDESADPPVPLFVVRTS